MARLLPLLILVAVLPSSAAALSARVVVYGATPAGLAAAVAAVEEGASVLVLEPSTHIGGMLAGGIAITDTGTPHLVGGLARRFFEEAAELQARPAREDPPLLLFQGRAIPYRAPRRWDLEPRLMHAVFEKWVRQHRLRVLTGQTIAAVSVEDGRIRSLRLAGGATAGGEVFIDASYEGDLMAGARVSHTWGRESQAQYNESLAGIRAPHFRRNYTAAEYATPTLDYMHHGQFGAGIGARQSGGRLLWGVQPAPSGPTGGADRLMQAYCFRLIATQRKDLLVPWPKPRRYQPQRYELLLRYIRAHPGISFARLVHLGPIPNGKWDLNASGPFSIDYIGGNLGFAEAGPAARRRIYQDHLDYQQGFLWFLAHDPRVPPALRQEVNSWGLCRDEYPDTGHWPVQLYIRECRRMLGDYIMTEHDVLRDNAKPDSVAMGSFVLDSHWVHRFAGADGNVRVEGHLDESINLARNPYEIPYRSLTPRPRECRNLLVPVCLSATHVALCTIRMEPVYMMLGEAAGRAAAWAALQNRPVQQLDVPALLKRLEARGGILNRRSARIP